MTFELVPHGALPLTVDQQHLQHDSNRTAGEYFAVEEKFYINDPSSGLITVSITRRSNENYLVPGPLCPASHVDVDAERNGVVVGVVDFAPLFGEEEGRACFLALPEGDVQRSQLVSCSK